MSTPRHPMPFGKEARAQQARFRATLRDPGQLLFAGQEALVAALRAWDRGQGRLDDWLDYHRLRYGW